MTTNPYESPLAVEDESPPATAAPREKGLVDLLALVAATIGGGLAGMTMGNLVAYRLGAFQRSFYEITHPISLALLIVGGLCGGCAAIWVADRRRARRN